MLKEKLHVVYTDKEARTSLLIWRAAIVLFGCLMPVYCLSLLNETNLIGEITLYVGVLASWFVILRYPHEKELRELNGQEHAELSRMLIELPELRAVFALALGNCKKLRRRDLNYVSKSFRNYEDNKAKTDALQLISSALQSS